MDRDLSTWKASPTSLQPGGRGEAVAVSHHPGGARPRADAPPGDGRRRPDRRTPRRALGLRGPGEPGPPTDAEVEAARGSLGFDDVQWSEDGALTKARAGIQLDASAIARAMPWTSQQTRSSRLASVLPHRGRRRDRHARREGRRFTLERRHRGPTRARGPRRARPRDPRRAPGPRSPPALGRPSPRAVTTATCARWKAASSPTRSIRGQGAPSITRPGRSPWSRTAARRTRSPRRRSCSGPRRASPCSSAWKAWRASSSSAIPVRRTGCALARHERLRSARVPAAR